MTDNRSRSVAADYYNIGNAYADLGQYDKAAAAFENALRLDASLVKADFNLALAYGKMKRYDDAAAILKRLLLADPAEHADSLHPRMGLSFGRQRR